MPTEDHSESRMRQPYNGPFAHPIGPALVMVIIGRKPIYVSEQQYTAMLRKLLGVPSSGMVFLKDVFSFHYCMYDVGKSFLVNLLNF